MPSDDLWIGGRFELQGEVGAGGMAVVHRAFDHQLERVVAVKIVHRGADVPRFEREAGMLAELDHPHIVRYVAHGPLPDGRAYLAMEWLEGETLAARLERGRLRTHEAVALLSRVADALTRPHARGVVHRDLKPENLYLRGGSVDRVVVLDFGIALGASGRLTRTGGVIGSAGYMAPEQARGARDVDARADVFALGAVLYECVAGRPAFSGSSPLAILAQVAFDEAPKLRDACAAPRGLDALCNRMLSRDPVLRPRDAGELHRALNDLRLDVTEEAESIPSTRASRTGGESELRAVAVVMVRATPSSAAVTMPASEATQSANRMLEICQASGAVQVLVDGTVVAIPQSRDSAREQAGAAAACALALRGEAPDLTIAIAIGSARHDLRSPAGDTLARAASLLEKAGHSAIRIDDGCAALLSERFVVEDGLLSGRRSTGGPRVLLGKPTPCVGREAELSAIEAALARCIDDESPVAVLVTAEPGMGKSRVREELLDRFGAWPTPVTSWGARSEPTSTGTPFGGARDIVLGALGLADESSKEVVAARLQHWRNEDSRCDRSQVVFLAELLGVADGLESPELAGARRDPQTMRDQLRLAFQSFVEAQCERGPVVLALEDAHWLDTSTLDLIESVIHAVAGIQLFVVAFCRPEGARALADAFGTRLANEVRLGPLPKRGAEALVRAVLGDGVSRATIGSLTERAGGTAFFLEELIRAEGEGRSEAAPRSILAVLHGRFDALSVESRKVLRAASVLGQGFELETIEAVSGLPRADVQTSVNELTRLELLAKSAAASRQLTFRHALVAEAAYATLTEDDRSLCHQLAAAHLATTPNPVPLTIARHHELAGDTEATVAWLVRAAEVAATYAIPAEVTECVERARSLGASGTQWGVLCARGAAAREWRGDYAGATELAREATALIEPGTPRWIEASRIAACGYARLGEANKARALGEEFLRWLERSDGDRVALVCAASAIGFQLHVNGSSTLAERVWSAAIADPASSEPLARPYASGIVARRAYLAGDVTVLADYSLSAARAFQEIGDVQRALVHESNHGFALGELGCFEAAERCHRAAMATLQRLGLTGPLASVKQNLGLVLSRVGRAPEAVVELEEALAAFEHQGAAAMTAITASLLAEALCLSGRQSEALGRAESAVVVAPPKTVSLAHALAIHGWLLLRIGSRSRDALEVTTQGMAVLDSLGAMSDGEMRLRVSHAQAQRACGDIEQANCTIAEARRILLERAGRIPRQDYRDSFLTRVTENAAILTAASSW